MGIKTTIRRAKSGDIDRIAAINAQVFNGHKDNVHRARQWVEALMRSFPVYHYFVLEFGGEVAGYIGWENKGGFLRPVPVIELEQLGIDPSHQGKGFAGLLCTQSLDQMIRWISENNNRIESHITVVVWCYALNLNALKVYAELFTDGMKGFREQFGDRAESMLALRVPMIRPERS